MSKLPILLLAAGLGLTLWLLSIRVQSAPVAAAGSPNVGGALATTDASTVPAVTPAAPAPPVDALFARAIEYLEAYRSVSAKVHARVNIFGREIFGQGVYLEEEPRRARRLRFELNINLGNQTSTLLNIADGHYFWSYQQLVGNEHTLTRHDIDRIARAMDQNADNPTLDRDGWWPSMGGLTKLLRRLWATGDFPPPLPAQLQGMRVWKLQGTWKQSFLAAVLPDQRAAAEKGRPFDLTKVPVSVQIPDTIVVYLGQEDLFPYRIEFGRSRAVKSADFPAAQAPGPLVQIQFLEVSVNVPIDPVQFNYNPGNLTPTDLTEPYLLSHGLLSN